MDRRTALRAIVGLSFAPHLLELDEEWIWVSNHKGPTHTQGILGAFRMCEWTPKDAARAAAVSERTVRLMWHVNPLHPPTP